MALSPDLRRILKLFLTVRKLVSGFLAKLVHHFFPIIFSLRLPSDFATIQVNLWIPTTVIAIQPPCLMCLGWPDADLQILLSWFPDAVFATPPGAPLPEHSILLLGPDLTLNLVADSIDSWHSTHPEYPLLAMPGSEDIAHFLDKPNLDDRVWATLSQPLNNNDRRLITRAIASVTRKESTVSAKLRLALVALENRNRSLQDQARRLSIDASTCPLTGLNNRRAVDRLITAETSAVIHAPLALGLVDIDRFRDANERFLHTGGDIILQGVSRLLQGTVRETDALGRMGGDEFLIVARETGYEGAVALGERLRQSIASGQFLVDNVNATVTVSVGFAVVGANQPITEAVLRQTAAQALREAKDAGRNKVVVRQINEIASSN